MDYSVSKWQSTKVIELGSAAFRQWRAQSHCNKIHGYLLTAKIWVGGSNLDDRNWIYDFGGFKKIREELQEQIDHKTVVAQDDPELDMFIELNKRGIIDLKILPAVGVEKFAEYVFNVVSKHIKADTNGRCWVDQVEVFEHDKNSAIYSRKEVIGNWLADCSTGVGLDGRVVVGANVTEPTILCEDIPKPTFPPNTLQSEGEIKMTETPVQPLDLSPGIKTVTSPFIPVDKNAATVGKSINAWSWRIVCWYSSRLTCIFKIFKCGLRQLLENHTFQHMLKLRDCLSLASSLISIGLMRR